MKPVKPVRRVRLERTHDIIVRPIRKAGQRKPAPIKSFSINEPTRTSEEIRDLLIKALERVR